MSDEPIDLGSEMSVLDNVIGKLQGVFNCSGAILLVGTEENREQVQCVAAAGETGPFEKGKWTPLNLTPASRLAEGERYVILRHTKDAESELSKLLRDKLRSSLWLPIEAERGYFGILGLFDRREGFFTGDEIPMLDIVASQISSIINLYTRLDEVTIKDEQTGLYNATYFRRRLADELGRCVRYDCEVSLVVLIVTAVSPTDKDKPQPVSEAAIRTTADAMVYCLRSTDVLARLDENTLAAILPETSAQGAAVVAARVGAQTARALGERLAEEGKFEIAVGAATRQSDTDTPEALIERARNNARRAASIG